MKRRPLSSPFLVWEEVFPNAACVLSLVDRLIHNAQIVTIDGDYYRMKEAPEKATAGVAKAKRAKRSASTNNNEATP